MPSAAPDLVAPRGLERGLVGTIAVSALLHAAALAFLIAVPGRFLSAPPRIQSYTVDLVAPDVIGGTNLVPGGGPRKPAPAKVEAPLAEPAPAAEPPAPVAPPPAAAKPAEAPKPPEPAPPPAVAAPPKPAPPPPRPVEAKPVEAPPKPVPQAEAPKPVAQPEKPPVVKPVPSKAEAKPQPKPDPKPAEKAEAKPAPKAEPKKVEPKSEPKVEAKAAKPEPPKPEAKPRAEAKPRPEAKPQAEAKPPPAAAKAKPEPAKPSEADQRDRAISDAVQRRAAQSTQSDATGKAVDQRIAAAVQRRAEQVEKGGSGVAGPGGPVSAGPATGVGGASADMLYVLYEGRMRERIRNAWAWTGADRGLTVVIQFNIAADGRILNVRTLTASGDPSYDASAERAVRAANPLEPVPEKYRDAFSTVELTFRASDLESR
ncbi:MAG: cell envelope integrity protein TolA [Candidatus Binatia bacterium]